MNLKIDLAKEKDNLNGGTMINIFFVVIMVILAIIDIRSAKTSNHKNYKSSIILIGILGVLSGILIGFYDIDIENIKDSIPNILYGLQISFYTLFASITLVLILGMYQKFLGFKKENKENLDFITLQIKKLDKLDELLSINSTNQNIKESLQDIKDSLNKLIESEFLSKNIESIQNGFEMLKDSNSNNTKLLIDRNKSCFNDIFEVNTRQIELLRDVNTNLKNIIESNKNNFSTLSKDNQAILEKLQDSNKDFKESFISSLTSLNTNFNTQIKELSNSIDSTLNQRISSLISSFTNTINLHFSENFKRFNNGIDSLIEWQEKHKNDLYALKENIEKQAKSLEKLNAITTNIIKRDEGMTTLYNEAIKILREYRIENKNLSEKLKTISSFGTNAVATLESMNNFFDDLNKHLKQTNANLINNTKNIIDNVFLDITKEFESKNKAMIDSIRSRNISLMTLLESMAKNIDSINLSTNNKIQSSIKETNNLGVIILQNNKDIYESYKKLGNDIELNLNSISKYASETMNDINKSGIKHLQSISKSYFDDMSNLQNTLLNNMSNSIYSNQEMLDSAINKLFNKYLETLEEITLSNSQAQIELSRTSIEDIKVLNSEVLHHIKENALFLNKSNIEILNIVEFLQKEIKDSIKNSNTLQNIAKENIKDIEKSLHNSSESFKNDYEWFLRRIRDIIGQRI